MSYTRMDINELWYSGLVSVAAGMMVLYCIGKPSSKKRPPTYIVEPNTTPSYTMKYETVFQGMECVPLDDIRLRELQCLYIKEVTEKGVTVVMCYSHDHEAFHYWCDNRNISFIELDTIAQLYTIVNQCKMVYRETEQFVVKKCARTISKSPIVSFKHYNRPNPKIHEEYHKYNRFTRQGSMQEWMHANEQGEWSANHGLDYTVLIWIASKLEVHQSSSESLSYTGWVSAMKMEPQ